MLQSSNAVVYVIEHAHDGAWHPTGNFRKTRAEAEELMKRIHRRFSTLYRVTPYERKPSP